MKVKILVYIFIIIILILYIYYTIILVYNNSLKDSNIYYDLSLIEHKDNVLIGSKDLKTWTKFSPTKYTIWFDTIFNNNLYISVGYSYKEDEPNIITSNDGESWKPLTIGTNMALYSIIYNNQFIAVGEAYDGFNITTSKDGISWNLIKTNTDNILNSIVFGNNMYVAVGNKIITSTDLITWITHDFSDTIELYSITYTNMFKVNQDNTSVYVAVGNNILSSIDGIKWTIQEYTTDISILYYRVDVNQWMVRPEYKVHFEVQFQFALLIEYVGLHHQKDFSKID
jgi:hypothetical protein